MDSLKYAQVWDLKGGVRISVTVHKSSSLAIRLKERHKKPIQPSFENLQCHKLISQLGQIK